MSNARGFSGGIMEIKVEGLEFSYMEKTPFEKKVLQEINFTIPSGSFTAIIGHTGSGKSTLIQHLNGLLKPSKGKIKIGKTVIEAGKKAKELKELRRRVGLVFQYPEHQLFEETVLDDICFGPKNFGVAEREAKRRAKSVLPLVGLSEDVLEKSPFDLSGGQMRRAAIAGVLAISPKVLILDEPTAGLDPHGRSEIMNMFKALHEEQQLTTILVTHHMTDAAVLADQIIVLDKGKIVLMGSPDEVFKDRATLEEIHLDVPDTVQLIYRLEEKLGQKLPKNLYTVEAVVNFIEKEIVNSKGT